ncbi:MAG: DUF3089 domain-containing protein [Lachnospiraceae bacterium]|nr:DUF3089 domain-containing protein [Lachnospiraceae bacterium]
MKKKHFKISSKMSSRIMMAAVCLILSVSVAGCGEKGTVDDANAAAKSDVITGLVGTPSDYSKEDNWMVIPKITHEVDTFYIYPTVYTDNSEDAKPICDIDNEEVRTKAQFIYEGQATVFEESTNVFAPYYRQSNINQVAGMDNKQLEEYQKQEQRTDVYAALDYYFAHYNNGRPFIIAGHSQGSIMTRIVLGEYMEAHPEYYERMVAAYVIGYSITSDFLHEHPYLKFAEGADDTGVIVSWNTEGPGNKGHRNLVVEDGAISINPINWKRDATYASADENLGSRILNEETGSYEIKQGFADAQLDTGRGVVICTTNTVEYTTATELFGPESLHNNDYALYYENLRENIKIRIENFLD